MVMYRRRPFRRRDYANINKLWPQKLKFVTSFDRFEVEQ